MKNKTLIFIIMCFVAWMLQPLMQPNYHMDAATITRGTTFGTTDLVTAARLHALVDSATISAIGNADISALAIDNGKLAANAITTDKVLDGTLLGTDHADRTFTSNLYGTNSVDGIALNTNISFRTGFLNFTNAVVGFTNNAINGVWVTGVTNSTGVSDAGKIVKLNDSGVLSTTITPFSSSFTSTNIVITAGGTVVNAHGLGGMPSLLQIRAIEVNAAGSSGYALNDEVLLDFGALQSADNTGISVVPDASNLNIRFGSAANVLYLLNKGTGAATAMTPGDWKIIIRAWK